MNYHHYCNYLNFTLTRLLILFHCITQKLTHFTYFLDKNTTETSKLYKLVQKF